MDERDEKPESLDRYWDPELEVLGELLEQMEDAGAMDLEELDGFFTALHCAPDIVAPNEYLPEVVGDGFENEEIFPNDDAIGLFLDLVEHHWNDVGAALNNDDFFVPLLLEDEEGKVYGNNWAIGFIRGLGLRDSVWHEVFDDENEFARLIPVLALANENSDDPEMRSYKEPVSDELRERLIAGISMTVGELYPCFAPQREAAAMRVAGKLSQGTGKDRKIGRNDPCYCGSGKKYKNAAAAWQSIRESPGRNSSSDAERDETCRSASQAGAFEREAVDGTENSGGDLLGAEKFLSEDLHFFASYRVDGSENFVE